MDEGIFKYEDCLLKHYIRTEAWLPMCKQRLVKVRAAGNPKTRRRLRYFTFCAVGAIDVLMLNVAGILSFSRRQGFNTVYFFDKSRQYVFETQKRIPGAIGFPGDFVNTVLSDPVMRPSSSRDTAEARELIRRQDTRERFIECFPFDVINLDLEEFLFKPNDHLPGRMIRAFKQVFEWQKRPLIISGDSSESLEGFSLMFTTQIGPPNISSEYLTMLRERLDVNIGNDTALGSLLVQRTGIDDARILQNEDFDSFKLATPKVLAHTLMDRDWYIDPGPGILVYEFERPSQTGSYKILHLVMDVKRKSPPEDYRAPGVDSREALEAYQRVTRQLFTEKATIVTEDSIDRERLQGNLERIKSRGRKYLLSDD